MNIKLRFLALLIFCGCTYRPTEKRLTQFHNNDARIVKSFYKNDKDTLRFDRILENGTRLTWVSGVIFQDKAIIHQKNRRLSLLSNNETAIDSITNSILKEGLNSAEGNESIMFIQIVPDSTMSDFQALGLNRLRQNIEDKIDERLKEKNIGKWFAGDLGAGANMLFYISDWEKAIQTVMEILKREELLDHVLIARRINTSKDDWIYEVVFPIEYQGVFNPM